MQLVRERLYTINKLRLKQKKLASITLTVMYSFNIVYSYLSASHFIDFNHSAFKKRFKERLKKRFKKVHCGFKPAEKRADIELIRVH